MMEPGGSKAKKGPPPCGICEENPSKYMCPRCGIPYCSLACYKNESKHLQCSESFYRDCVVEDIKSEQRSDPESAKRMKEILQRVHDQFSNEGTQDLEGDEGDEELDSDDDEPLDKRLDGIDLNDAEEVWKHLTEEERREFQSLTKNMEMAGDIIPEWIPWWYEEPEKKLVVEMSDDSKTEGASSNSLHSFLKLHKRQPDILEPIPQMSDLTKVQPNQHVAKGLINVVTAYVWAARLFNGDLFDPAKVVEIASCIIYLSSFLNKDAVFKNIEHAIADVPLNACQVPVLSEGGTAIQTGLNRDIWVIIKGPENLKRTTTSCKLYLLSALSECHSVFIKAGKVLKRNGEDPTKFKITGDHYSDSFSKLFPSPPPVLSADPKLVNKAKRKLLYLIAFANEFLESTNLEGGILV